MTAELSHLDARGQAHMVDIGAKEDSSREAVAEVLVHLSEEALQLIVEGGHTKGDVAAVARIAAIQAAKRCADLLPLCHPLALSSVDVEVAPDLAECCLRLRTTCRLRGRTGVEMEALTAAAVGALAVYDMCKAVDRSMVIGDLRLLSKSGGRSGNWCRDDD